MSFCINCGTRLQDDAKYCPNCGTPVASRQSDSYKTREQEFAGKIIKCPVCGEELPSLTAICPACGHEINSARVSSAIKDFTDQISQCDIAIANGASEPKTGWKSWGKWKKVGWVFLNIYTLCVPLVLYLLLPLLGIVGMSALTREEKTKAQLINNFPFPNDRESILEALLYIKAQMASLASGEIDRNTSRWIKIWKNKASQLFEKAEIMFKEDRIANDAYSAILASEKKVKRSLLIRVIVAAVVVALYMGFIFFRNDVVKLIAGARSTLKLTSASYQEDTETIDWSKLVLGEHIPDFGYDEAEVVWDTDNVLILYFYNMESSKFESYIEECKNFGYTIDAKDSGANYTAYNQDGYYLHLQYLDFTDDKRLTIDLKDPIKRNQIIWPSSKLVKKLPKPKTLIGEVSTESTEAYAIYLVDIEPTYFSEYVSLCMDKGFNVDYSKSDTCFRAENKDGVSLTIEYRGFNTLYIYIKNYD